MIDRDLFLDRLLRASVGCRDFTKKFVLDELLDTHLFWVCLNCSYDGNPLHDDEVAFPEDRHRYPERVGPLEAVDVVSMLWRDGRIPEWIDMRVIEADARATYFELSCCGRFTSRADFLYYDRTDTPPFGVKDPAYPARLFDAVMNGEPVEKFGLAESPQRDSRDRPSIGTGQGAPYR